MDLQSIVEAGGHFKLEVSPCDLMHFAEVLIEKAQAIKEKEMNSRLDEDEQFLSSEEELPDVQYLLHHTLVVA